MMKPVSEDEAAELIKGSANKLAEDIEQGCMDRLLFESEEVGTVTLTISPDFMGNLMRYRVECIDPKSGDVIAHAFETYKPLTTDEAIDKAIPHLVQLINDKGEG